MVAGYLTAQKEGKYKHLDLSDLIDLAFVKGVGDELEP